MVGLPHYCLMCYCSGKLKKSPADMASVLLDGIINYSSSTKPTHLKLVCIVIPDDEKLREFAKVLAAKVAEKKISV